MKNYETVLTHVKTLITYLSNAPSNVFGRGIITHPALTAKFAAEIAEREKADVQIVTVASWLHDIATLTCYDKLYKDHHIHGANSAREILQPFDVDEKDIDKVCNCILHHRGSIVKSPKMTPEEISVADGDAIAHMCDIPGLLHLAYGVNGLGRDEGKKFVCQKLKRSFDKLSRESRNEYGHIYSHALDILRIDERCLETQIL